MLIVHVHVHVKADCVEAFRAATIENARESVKEPGIARFDVVQQADDPTALCWWKFIAPPTHPRSTRKPRTTPNGATPSPR